MPFADRAGERTRISENHRADLPSRIFQKNRLSGHGQGSVSAEDVARVSGMPETRTVRRNGDVSGFVIYKNKTGNKKAAVPAAFLFSKK